MPDRFSRTRCAPAEQKRYDSRVCRQASHRDSVDLRPSGYGGFSGQGQDLYPKHMIRHIPDGRSLTSEIVHLRSPAFNFWAIADGADGLRRPTSVKRARIRRGRASKARLKAQLSLRALAKWIVSDSAARHVGTGLVRSCSISRRISVNSALGTASASWKVTYRPWRTTLAPILTSLLRNVVSDHCFTSCGNAKVRMKLARL